MATQDGDDQERSLDEKCRIILEELYDNRGLDFDQTARLLADFRILTREKTISSDVIDEKCLKALVDLSSKTHTEAQKCLSNLILNYANVRKTLIEPYVDCVESRLTNILNSDRADHSQSSNDSQQHCQVLYYDLRIIFLLSALCSSSRRNIRDRLLTPLLKVTLLETDQFRKQNYLLVIESLKTLFNLTMDNEVDTELASEVIKKLMGSVGTEKLRDFEPTDGDHTEKLIVNLIHLLTNMPKSVYLELSDEDVDKVLTHLDEQLKSYSKSSFRDTILPVLNTSTNICRHNESVRRRWYKDIISSTKEFDKRPEEYDTLRGRLVKLMTSIDTQIKDIAAEFLYALCGEDSDKFITYTGFGNSVGFLTNKGLLRPGSVPTRDESSVDPDDNYQEVRERVDAITGRIEPPRTNPMEGMSEEEKEWHAMELASNIEKLSRLGIITPMKVDQDGKMSELHPKGDDQ